MKKIILAGNPNVGKSVVFNRLTGVRVISSNYPGTTVEFSKGHIHIGEDHIDIIDLPGTYSLDPTSPAEEVAVKLLEEVSKEDDVILINVIDATNLERNLLLTLQLLRLKLPMVICLNLWDEAKHHGIKINVEELEKMLGVPIVPTVAITAEGIKKLVDSISSATISSFEYNPEEKWQQIGKVIESVQRVTHRHHTFLERLGEISINPYTGLPIALVILFISFEVIRFIGEGLISWVFDPIFETLWKPVMMKVSGFLSFSPFLHNLLIGQLVEGEIDFGFSFGLLTTGLYVPFAAVLPYVFAFYLILSIMEDTGYLPRLGVLLDRMMHKVGLHGMSVIPMLLGFGCNVPGVLASRILETRRERFIAMTLTAIAIPCMAQLAMVFGLIGEFGFKGIFVVFLTLFLIWVIVGIIMNKIVKGESPEIFVEIPPYRIPHFGTLVKKLWMRIRGFLKEAIPYVLLGVLIVNILYSFGVIQFIGKLFAPIVKFLFGLPVEAVGAIIIGFLRKDVAVGMLVPLNLDLKQTIIASVILSIYFPCVATFIMLVKELGVWDMVKSVGIMIITTLIVGTLLNLIL
ncbi:ferrous iron transporter B [Candidatus Dependentiae bacterium]|nr:ferrous iron transporter B [Candidatus Dependentiae bacterium]